MTPITSLFKARNKNHWVIFPMFKEVLSFGFLRKIVTSMVCDNQMRCERNYSGDPPDRGLKSSATISIRCIIQIHMISLNQTANCEAVILHIAKAGWNMYILDLILQHLKQILSYLQTKSPRSCTRGEVSGHKTKTDLSRRGHFKTNGFVCGVFSWKMFF